MSYQTKSKKRNTSFSRIVQIAAGLSIGILICVWLFQQVDYAALVESMRALNGTWLLACCAFQLASFVLRSIRWQWLLAADKQRTGLMAVFWATMAGYLVNFILPRAGEVFRCMVLNKTSGIQRLRAFGTVVSERIVDLLSIALCVLLALLVEFDYILDHLTRAGHALLNNTYVWIVLGVLVALGLLYFPYKERLNKYFQPTRIRLLFAQIGRGIHSIRYLDNLWRFIAVSLLIWACYYFACYAAIMAHPLGHTIPWTAGVVILALSSIGAIAPIQGGIGIFHGIVAYILLYYGMPAPVALGIAIVLHGIFTLLSVGFGLLGVGMYFFPKRSLRNLKRSLRKHNQTEPK